MATMDIVDAILNEYKRQYSLYVAFTEKVEELIEELLKENDIRIHSVTSRVKEVAALQKKLGQPEKRYSKLTDVTDIAGVRIITYFPDDLDLVAKLVQKEFDIDEDRSVDKRKLLDPDRFGYLSLHYVVKLSADRLKLSEYRRFADCPIEIQIRSILQHAWAEIEHDLGYKTKLEIPKQIRRRFSRLAGLLEIADTEFVQIRENLMEYEEAIPQQIIDAPKSVLIDKDSLLSFVRKSPIIHKIDKEIASVADSEIIENKDIIRRCVGELIYVGVENIADLDSALCKLERTISKFARLWITPKKYKTLSAGICIIYLVYTLIGSKNSVELAHDYLRKFDIGIESGQRAAAEKIISVYSEATA